jgi:hypothetical protein
MEGNHEERFRRPGNVDWALWRLVEPTYWFELSRRNIQWVPYSNRDKDIYRIGKMSFIHGFSCSEHAVKMEATSFGCVVHGHTHRIAMFQPRACGVAHTGFNIGCMCQLDLDYASTGRPRGWAQAFGFGYFFKSGHFSFYIARLIGKEFVIDGKVYSRGVIKHESDTGV